jgi:hypothetical protein
VPGSWSTGEAVAEITTSLDDLNRKLDVYSEHLFRQARWEAELIAADLRLTDAPPLAERTVQSAESLAAAFDRIGPGIERIAAVAEATPALVAAERKAAIDGVSGDLTRMMAFLEQERIVALKQVTAERIAALGTISQAVSEESAGSSSRPADPARSTAGAWRRAGKVVAGGATSRARPASRTRAPVSSSSAARR